MRRSPPRAPPAWRSTRSARCGPASQDHAVFADEIRHDRFRNTPADQLLTGLRGKDVLLVFVESYGKVAVQDSVVLAAGRSRLSTGTPSDCRPPASPPAARFLTSPTFGGAQLAGALHHAVGRLGRQPAALRPARRDATASRSARRSSGPGGGPSATCRRTTGPGRRGRRSTTTTSSTTGATSAIAARSSRTPRCPTSTSSRPCSASSSRSRDRRPVFAEVDLVSSHTPWTRIPQLIDWNDVGDGSIFNTHAGRRPADAGPSSSATSTRVRAAYGQSIEYTPERPGLVRAALRQRRISCSSSWATTSPRRSSPARTRVTTCRSRSSPTTRRCSDQIAGWGWSTGLRPGPQAPVWPMDAFRDRFLSAFGS